MTFKLDIPLNADATNQINDLVRALRLVADDMAARVQMHAGPLVVGDTDRWEWNDESLIARMEVKA